MESLSYRLEPRKARGFDSARQVTSFRLHGYPNAATTACRSPESLQRRVRGVTLWLPAVFRFARAGHLAAEFRVLCAWLPFCEHGREAQRVARPIISTPLYSCQEASGLSIALC